MKNNSSTKNSSESTKIKNQKSHTYSRNIFVSLITHSIIKSVSWFFIGVLLGLFLFVTFTFIFFQNTYRDVIYPGVRINGVAFDGKTEKDVKNYFLEKNKKISENKLLFESGTDEVYIRAGDINLGYDANLLSKQAFSIGRSNDTLANISLVFQTYLYGVSLQPAYYYSENSLQERLSPLIEKLTIEPIDALFVFDGQKVSAFRPSQKGQKINMEGIQSTLREEIPYILTSKKNLTITIPVTTQVVEPKTTTDEVNNLGIKEEIGTGRSSFKGSIANRIYNLTLAASRVNGILVAPNEVFSFNKALGDVTDKTGYKQAYVIQNGRTVLGDGGGVCQISTTFFRTLLNAGLPIVERNAHAYRVGYYEQDSEPGFDATIFYPTIDLRFKNDTGHYILIQNVIDSENQTITYALYGTKDGREVKISKPVISNKTPAPEPLYQDDPELPKGTTKQVDFAATGATVIFKRDVKKNGITIISEKYTSRYRPWQAVYLKGTKE